MATQGETGESAPQDARDAAEFIDSMRRLKERSGLTYRQLEQGAARRDEVLPRSTLADVLRRGSLPRPEVLAAFVHACGEGERVDTWLAARDRIAAAAPPEPPPSPAAPGDVEPGGPEPGAVDGAPARRRRVLGARPAPAVGGLILLLAAGALALAYVLNGSGSSSAAEGPAEGWSQIRPAATPDLCLTEGRARNGRYDSAVAVQHPCADAAPPRVYLEGVGDGLYRVQWHHPEFGKGCLTALTSGPVQGMFEPRDNCDEATRFHVEPADAPLADGYRLRLADSELCVGIVDGETGPGAEAIQQECGEQADQQFLVGPA
ncbi:XRE family transcriptional regulator [Streptomyces sp. NPDC006645]|uniref:RICIN domain-containing protein n=1 Tax=unclassified Streptomyces TaxID=2593676 RepID=UPI0033BE1BDA